MQRLKTPPSRGRAAGLSRHELEGKFSGKYLSLTSFKSGGKGVGTPVWFVIEDGRLLIRTDGDSFKAKRIRRNPSVMIAPCTASGRIRSGTVAATAEFLPNSELDHVRDLMARKYRIDRILILPLYRAVQRLRGVHRGSAEVALSITPTEEALGRNSSEDSR